MIHDLGLFKLNWMYLKLIWNLIKIKSVIEIEFEV